jgi:hypothetical protein
MKQIDFKDPYSRKITYEIDIDQLQSITNLHLNKDTSMNNVNSVNQDIITVLKK